MLERLPIRMSRRELLRQLGYWGLALTGLGSTGCRVVTPEPTDLPDIPHEARFYRPVRGQSVQCELCFRTCLIPEGGRGFCRNRKNFDGRLYSLVYGKPCAIQLDPIEKEPAFHMLPGSTIFCTSTASCNNRCLFCHNWHISQISVEEADNHELSPTEAVRMAQDGTASFILYAEPSLPAAFSFTYAEPTVFYEYMYDVAKLARGAGFMALCHTNGLIKPEPLRELLGILDAVTVDLKAFTPEFYREICSSELEPVLETLKLIADSGKHLEIVNLVIPSLNDNLEDIRRMCRWIVENLGGKVPLHFTRFFPTYKLTHLPPTPVETLETAREIAVKAGLEYVYIGNVPGHKHNSTFCPRCQRLLIERKHFRVVANHLKGSHCPACDHPVPGIWERR